MSKVLSFVPLGKLFDNLPEYVEFNFTDKSKSFLKNNHTNCKSDLCEKYMNYKDGLPKEVNEWGKTFGLDLGLFEDDNAYALSTIMHLAMNWEKPSEKDKIEYKKTFYQAGMNSRAYSTLNKGTYEIQLEDKELRFLVSLEKIPSILLENPLNFLSRNKKVLLTTPLAKLREKDDLSEHFKDCTALVKNRPYDCTNVNVITEFDMTLEGAEVKQAASVEMTFSSCLPVEFPERVVIDKPFYVYIMIEDSLLFSAYVDSDSFIKV